MTSDHQFDPGCVFFPLILHFFGTVHGMIDLASRGVRRAIKNSAEHSRMSAEEVATRIDTSRADESGLISNLLAAGVTASIGEISLASRVSESRLTPDIELLAQEVYEHGSNVLGDPTLRSAGHLLVLGYAVAEDRLEDQDRAGPEWQFLRHCRNAAAHDNRVSFREGGPTKRAAWRSLNLTPESAGVPLFGPTGTEHLLGPADPVLLLWDLEQMHRDKLRAAT